MTVGLIALQGAVAPHKTLLGGLGVDVTEVRTPEELDGVDAVVLPGGESTTMWHLLGVSGLGDALRRRLSDGLPALGTCAGMIVLAAGVVDGRSDQGSLGAIDITVRRNAFGRQIASFEQPIAVAGLGDEPFHGVFIRAPVVERCGPDVEVLASLNGQPVAVRHRNVVATAFHPELTSDPRIHKLFVDTAGIG